MTKTLNEALLAFQSLQVTAKKDGKNPHFRSNYATLESVISAASQAQQFGICFTQEIDFDVVDGSIVQFVRTVIIHAPSGETRMSRTPIKTKDDTDAQKMGSGLAYSKRYGLQAIMGIPSSSEDDDGNAATVKSAAPLVKKKLTSPPSAGVSPPSPAPEAPNSGLKSKIASVSDLAGLNALYTQERNTIEAMADDERKQVIALFSARKAELKG
jgi:hypothetical protein